MDWGDIRITGDRVIITPANGTVWLTKHQIADLFECFTAKVIANIRAILKADILDERKVCHLHRYENNSSVELYNLEVIMVLAFRIKTHNAKVFREWLMKKAVQERSDRQISVVVPWSDRIFLN